MLTNKLVIATCGAGLIGRIFYRTLTEAGTNFVNGQNLVVDDGFTL
jgi:hypothetical protein